MKIRCKKLSKLELIIITLFVFQFVWLSDIDTMIWKNQAEGDSYGGKYNKNSPLITTTWNLAQRAKSKRMRQSPKGADERQRGKSVRSPSQRAMIVCVVAVNLSKLKSKVEGVNMEVNPHSIWKQTKIISALVVWYSQIDVFIFYTNKTRF